MARVVKRIKYLQLFEQDGKQYAYFRRPGGKKIRLHAEVGTFEFEAELEMARKSKAGGPAVGTLGHLIDKYQATDDWKGLREKTRVSYQRAIDEMKDMRPIRLVALDRPAILKLRNNRIMPKRGRWMANYFVSVLGVLLGLAYDEGMIRKNPLAERVRRIRKPRGSKRANRPWTLSERSVVLTEAPWHLRIPIALALASGLRKADILTAKMTDIEAGKLSIYTSKRDTPLRLPLHPVILNALAARPKEVGPEKKRRMVADTICITSRGDAWTETGFNASWIKFRAGLEEEGKIAPGLTIHGGRHTIGTLLKEAGAHDDDVAQVLAQMSSEMGKHYSREADLPEDLADKVVKLRMQA